MTYKAPQHARDHRPAWVEGGPGSDPFDWLEEPTSGGATNLPWAKGVSAPVSVSDGVYSSLPIDSGSQGVAPGQTDITFTTDHFIIHTRGMWLVSYYVLWQIGMNGFQQADFGLVSSGPPVNFISEVSPTSSSGTAVNRVCQPVLVTTTPKSTSLVVVQYGDPPSDAVGTIIITFLGPAAGTFPAG